MGLLSNYLLHTDTVVDILRGSPDAVACLRELAPAGCAMSVVSIGDLVHGAERSAKPVEAERRVRCFLREMPVLPIDCEIAWTYGRLQLASVRAIRGLWTAVISLLPQLRRFMI